MFGLCSVPTISLRSDNAVKESSLQHMTWLSYTLLQCKTPLVQTGLVQIKEQVQLQHGMDIPLSKQEFDHLIVPIL